MSLAPHRYTRQQIFDLVWESPTTSIAKTIGVSDVAVAKACRKANVPLPPRGYWAKLSAGKPVTRAELPRRGLGSSDLIYIGGSTYQHDQKAADLNSQPPEPPSFQESLRDVAERADSMLDNIKHPKSLSNSHHVIAKVLLEDQRRQEEWEKFPFPWTKPLFNTPQTRRILKILNSIFYVMTRVGEKPYLKCKDGSFEAGVIVGDTVVPLVVEPAISKKRSSTNGNLTETDSKLRLDICPSYHMEDVIQTCWVEDGEFKLEVEIRQISKNILIAGEILYRANEKLCYEQLLRIRAYREEAMLAAQARIERERQELERRLAKRKQRRLLADVAGWRRAIDIRAFVAALNSREEGKGTSASKDRISEWSAWALAEADRLDPLNRSFEELVDYLWDNNLPGP